MTTLLIDLGNTALKWTPIEEPDNPHTIIHKGSTHFKEELYDLWLNMRPKRIIGCTVAAPVVAYSMELGAYAAVLSRSHDAQQLL